LKSLIPFYLGIGICISNKVNKKDLLPPRLLTWHSKAAIGSAVMESPVAHGLKDLIERI